MRHSIKYFHFPNRTCCSKIVSIIIKLPSKWSTSEPNASFVSIQYKFCSKLRRLAIKLCVYVYLFIAGYLYNTRLYLLSKVRIYQFSLDVNLCYRTFIHIMKTFYVLYKPVSSIWSFFDLLEKIYEKMCYIVESGINYQYRVPGPIVLELIRICIKKKSNMLI